MSKIGVFWIGWKNEITVKVSYRGYGTRRTIDKIFHKNETEYQNYVQFDNVVFHARVSDYSGNYPTCG